MHSIATHISGLNGSLCVIICIQKLSLLGDWRSRDQSQQVGPTHKHHPDVLEIRSAAKPQHPDGDRSDDRRDIGH